MSACYCDYGDTPIFYYAKVHQASKRYRCDDCTGFIEKGEQYERADGLWYRSDGVYCYRTCERCYEIRKWVSNNVPCFCYVHGDLRETTYEAVEDARYRAPEETAGLRFGLLRRFVARDKLNRERAAA